MNVLDIIKNVIILHQFNKCNKNKIKASYSLDRRHDRDLAGGYFLTLFPRHTNVPSLLYLGVRPFPARPPSPHKGDRNEKRGWQNNTSPLWCYLVYVRRRATGVILLQKGYWFGQLCGETKIYRSSPVTVYEVVSNNLRLQNIRRIAHRPRHTNRQCNMWCWTAS